MKHIKQFFMVQMMRNYIIKGDDMAYLDTGNNDVRTEGMSYAMMIKIKGLEKEFDCLGSGLKIYVDGRRENAGYFAWSVAPDEQNSYGPST